jgi:hypothetical protein
MDIAGFPNSGYVPVSSSIARKRSGLSLDAAAPRSASPAAFRQTVSQTVTGDAAMRGGDSFHATKATRVRFRGGPPPSALPIEIQAAMDTFARAFKAKEGIAFASDGYDRASDESFNQGWAMHDLLEKWATKLATEASAETLPGEHSMEMEPEEAAATAEKEARKARNHAYKLAQDQAKILSQTYGLEDKETFGNQFLQPNSKASKENKARLADIDRRLERVDRVLKRSAIQSHEPNDFLGVITEILAIDSLMAAETRTRSYAQMFSSKRKPSLSRHSSTSSRPVLLEELMTTLKDAQEHEGKYSSGELREFINNAYIQFKTRRFNKSANAEVRSLRSRRSGNSFQDGDKTPSEGVNTPSRKRAVTFRETKPPTLPGLQTSQSTFGLGMLGDDIAMRTPDIVEWMADGDPPYAAGQWTSSAISPNDDMSLLLSGVEERPVPARLMGPPLTSKRSRDRDSENSTQSLIDWLENLIVAERGKVSPDSQSLQKMERTQKKLRDKLV